jgi:hypothetical protein
MRTRAVTHTQRLQLQAAVVAEVAEGSSTGVLSHLRPGTLMSTLRGLRVWELACYDLAAKLGCTSLVGLARYLGHTRTLFSTLRSTGRTPGSALCQRLVAADPARRFPVAVFRDPRLVTAVPEAVEAGQTSDWSVWAPPPSPESKVVEMKPPQTAGLQQQWGRLTADMATCKPLSAPPAGVDIVDSAFDRGVLPLPPPSLTRAAALLPPEPIPLDEFLSIYARSTRDVLRSALHTHTQQILIAATQRLSPTDLAVAVKAIYAESVVAADGMSTLMSELTPSS